MNLSVRQPHALRVDSNELATRGFVTVAYPPLLRTRVQSAMASWKNFCALSIEEKRKLSGGSRLRDFGYMKREDAGPKADDKELFHVVRRRLPELHSAADAMADRRAGAFIDAIDILLEASVPLIQAFAQSVEREYSLRGFEAEVMRSQDNWTFRYLHYFSGERPALANAHADRGGFTFHTWEDHDGGEYLDFDKNWRPWPVSETQTIIFPSMGLQYRSQGQLKALWHRVVPNHTTVAQGRYSMVIFIDFAMNHRYNDAARRLQDFEPGFNYRLTHEDFAKLFVPSNGMPQTA